MTDENTRKVYREAGLGRELTPGARPAVLVVDFSCGFTNPEASLGSDMDAEVEATKQLLDVARSKHLPIIFTTIGFQPNMQDAGLWIQKSPTLSELQIGTIWVNIDPRLRPGPDEVVIVKKGASAFFGTNLVAILNSRQADSVVLCGATTSGCVRATAIDLLQYGFPTLVPRECVGDRAAAPHEANLFDINAKYADVVSLSDVMSYLEGLPAPAATSTRP